jgi:VanZ family protein
MSEEGHRFGRTRLLLVLAAVAVAAQLVCLYSPTGPPTPVWFPQADKLEHLLGFGAPVCLILLYQAARPGQDGIGRRTALVVTGLFSVHAVLSELIQHFFYRHRTGDPFDVLADWMGVVLGWATAQLVVGRSQARRSKSKTASRYR